MTEQDEPIYDMQLRAAEVAASKPKHTPGPWEWTEPFGESRTLTTGSGREPIIQAAAYEQPYLHASEADEALLAAAPELYAALKAAQWGNYSEGRERCPDCSGAFDEGHRKWCGIAAALAKAEGREEA